MNFRVKGKEPLRVTLRARGERGVARRRARDVAQTGTDSRRNLEVTPVGLAEELDARE